MKKGADDEGDHGSLPPERWLSSIRFRFTLLRIQKYRQKPKPTEKIESIKDMYIL